MRRLPLLLATLVLGAQAPGQEAEEAETAKDPKSGLSVRLPDGWSREGGREKGSIRFAGLYDITPQRYVLFTVETGPSTGFDEAVWLQNEKAAVPRYLKTQDTPWTTEPIMVGGARAGRFTVGGKANAEKEYELRIRRCGLVRNDVFFQITEYSYGKAHEDAADPLKAMWEAIKFEEPNPFAEDEKKEEEGGEEEKPAGEEAGGGGGGEAPKGEPIVVEDKAGNFKVSVPPGWTLDRVPAEDEGNGTRVFMHREQGGTGVAWIEIARIAIGRSDFFEQNEAGDAVEKLINGDLHLFDNFFEDGAHKTIRPTIDARGRLGGADKSCGFEVRGLKLSEEAKIAEAQALINRGDASVKLPEFPEIVVRGRLAMVSPHVYVTFVQTLRGMPANDTLEAEIAQIQDSIELANTEGTPPALESEPGTPFGNTLADPKNASERKGSRLHEYKKGAKAVAALKFDFVLPPGFQEVEKVTDRDEGKVYPNGENLALQVVAQDGNNGWVWFRVVVRSSKSLGSNEPFEDKNQTFGTWISNFESRARGTGKLPKKPVQVRFGNLSGDGCEMQGKINKFNATEINMVTVEGGWWIKVELRTRGTGATTFAKQIERFKKNFKANKK